MNVALPPPSSCRTRCQQVQEWDGLGVVCMLVGAALVVVGAPTLDDEHGVPMTFNETTEFSLLSRVDTIIVIYQKNMFAYVVRYYDLPLTTLTPPFCLFFYLFFFEISSTPFGSHIFLQGCFWCRWSCHRYLYFFNLSAAASWSSSSRG